MYVRRARPQTQFDHQPITMAAEDTIANHLGITLSFLSELADPSWTDICLDGRSLTIPHVYTVANRTRDVTIRIKETSIQEMETNAGFLQKKIQEGMVIYGVSTGYGGSADVRCDDLLEIQRSLIRHLNAGFGDKLPPEVVRGVMLTRANSLSLAYSGVRPCVPGLLLEMLHKDIIPQVPKRGSVSASGDLMPTSYIAAAMMGREDCKVCVQGVEMGASEALQRASLQPVTFQAKEALATVNSSSFASVLAACVLLDANVAVVLTQAATAMSVEAMCGRTQSFHPTVHRCMPHPGQQHVAANVRYLLNGSRFVTAETGHDDNPTSLKQDRYALRTSPQWLGPVVETLVQAVRRVTTEINSANDNPLIDHRQGKILHCGNFQGTSVTVAMDQARQGLQLCGKLLFAQMSEIVNCQMNNGLPPNLSGCDVSRDFGFKGMDTAMASYMSELDYLTNPITNHVLSAEMHNQGVNSLALISARLTQQALGILQMMLTNILCAHLQAIDLRWLQKKVEQQLERLFSKYKVKPVASVVWPWYNFVYNPRTTAEAVFASGATNGVDKTVFVDDLAAKMEMLLDGVRTGQNTEEIASQLGQGTRQLYTHLRSTLELPFNCGQRPLDTTLEKLFKVIKGRDMDGVIADMFHTC